LWRAREGESRILGQGSRRLGEVEVEVAEFRDRSEFGRRLPCLDEGGGPSGKFRRRPGADAFDFLVDGQHLLAPFGHELLPARLLARGQLRQSGALLPCDLLLESGGLGF